MFLHCIWVLASVLTLSFHQLPQIEGSPTVKIKGFVYQDPQGHWILSQEPGLKSCCIGSIHKAQEQILLDIYPHGETSVGMVYTFQGTLTRRDEGLFPAYLLTDVLWVESSTPSNPLLLVALLLLTGVCVCLVIKILRLRCP